MTKPDFFHWCALAAGSIAKEDGNFDDSEYVRKLAYAMYESVLKVKRGFHHAEGCSGLVQIRARSNPQK